jgi:geranylgeranyl diphosphate synthase type II
MKIGAVISGAAQKDTELLYEAGRNLGLAFQLKDDLLDTFGNVSKFGKRIGGDIIENKKTYLFICARDMAESADREELQRLYKISDISEEAKINAVCDIFKKTHVQKLTEEKIKMYVDQAVSCCNNLSSSPETKKELARLFDYLITREN